MNNQADVVHRHNCPGPVKGRNINDSNSPNFHQVLQNRRGRPNQGLLVPRIDLHPVIRDEPVTAPNQFQGRFTLTDTGITGNQDTDPANVN